MRIWWSAVSNAAERSSRMTTEDREAGSSSMRARRAVSVEWIESRLVTVKEVVLVGHAQVFWKEKVDVRQVCNSLHQKG